MEKKRAAFLLLTIMLPLILMTILMAPVLAAFSEMGGSASPTRNLNGVFRRVDHGAEKIGPQLQSELLAGANGETHRFIIRLRGKSNLQLNSLPRSAQARRVKVVSRLRHTAASSQAGLVKQLNALQQAGEIDYFQPFWIINGVAASGTADAIRQIAARPEVKEIRLDVGFRYVHPPSHTINLESPSQVALPDVALPGWGQERIGAPYVWHGLGIDGSGITVAIMDTGVDWLHPDLIASYRGNSGSSVDHRGNWFNTVVPTNTEPVDLIGHGTHVAGIAIGQNGIGTAPGAQWIAVNIADQYGFIYESTVHSGFQWLMAPDGDPTLSPDVINNSWGGSPFATSFVEDVSALRAAGIIAVFAAGNEGPFSETINSPASYTGTLSVGASDVIDEVAWFSSRGPSPLSADQKPWIVAPGTRILSTIPGNGYSLSTGTSMATPHVAGAVALLKSANSALSQSQIQQILANTAVPISVTHPNPASGWGRLDAYAAVASQVSTGAIQGVVQSGVTPLAHITVTIRTASGDALAYRTDATGRYEAVLRPGLYSLETSPFGYITAGVSGISVTWGQTVTTNLNLTPLPLGAIEGQVQEAVSGLPLSTEIRLTGTPVTTTSDTDGSFLLTLPAGNYDLVIEAKGHRLGRSPAQVIAGQTNKIDFSLESAPNILLVDSGQWYYNSYAGYYRRGLSDINYGHDQWTIRNPFKDIPRDADLEPYDVVLWSSPLDSPGFIGANDVITNFLGAGGNLLISGQNVGSHDGVGFGTQVWWYRDLEAVFNGKTTVSQTISGVPGIVFQGITLTLNGPDSAGNQLDVDASRPRTLSLTGEGLLYESGQAAGLLAGHCDPFRIAYFGFGLEGVSGGADRAALLDNTLDFFASPRQETGVIWVEDNVDDFAVAGSTLVYTLTVRNLSESVTDTFHIEVASAVWPTALTTDTLTLGSCQTGRSVVTIDVPDDAPAGSRQTTLIRARSGNDSNVEAVYELSHQVPGHILLVDDDRWYDQEAVFQDALDAMDLQYDYWDIGWDEDKRGSPPAAVLNSYDIVIWFTGYDWFAPVTPLEEQLLTDYLAQGGRLFLNSQDFLYYHHQSPLARDYLGVIEYRESVTPTRVFGGDNPFLPRRLSGPLRLAYDPYKNFSDGLIPGPDSQSRPFLWHDQGMAAGVTTEGPGFRTVFWAFPFETLPQSAQADAMNGIIGWLGDLGDSTFTADRRTELPGAARTYTLTLRNIDSGRSIQVWVTNTLPISLMMQANTITGGAVYDPVKRQLRWSGLLGIGKSYQITYQAIPSPGLPAGTRVDNTAIIHYARHDMRFARTATTWLNAPDLSRSILTAAVTSPGSVQWVTYTMQLRNTGLAAAIGMSVTLRLPGELLPVTGTLQVSGGFTQQHAGHVDWQGDIAAGASVTVSLAMTRPMAIASQWLPATAYINDGVTDLIVRDTIPYLRPYQRYFPLVFRP